MDLLRFELDRVALHWNQHRMQKSRRLYEGPHGKPDVMFFVPAMYDTNDFITDTVQQEVEILSRLHTDSVTDVSPEFQELMDKFGFRKPYTIDDALELYVNTISLIEDLDTA